MPENKGSVDVGPITLAIKGHSQCQYYARKSRPSDPNLCDSPD